VNVVTRSIQCKSIEVQSFLIRPNKAKDQYAPPKKHENQPGERPAQSQEAFVDYNRKKNVIY